MKKVILTIVIICNSISYAQIETKEQKAIIKEFLTDCAEKYNYNYQMSEWQNCLDNGLKKDSTIAELWQKKAMPYFKARKYEVGMPFLDKAVKYDSKTWQPYRGFIKCIFSKSYKDAIADLEDCKQKYGNQYVMDHTYDFYIAISYLQLNEYEKAEKLLQNYVDEIYEKRQKLEHPTAYFYLGIAKYELKKYQEAIDIFDKALILIPQFSDVKYYKSVCIVNLGNKEEATKLWKESKADFEKGFKLNEYNTVYETYPYQKKWDK